MKRTMIGIVAALLVAPAAHAEPPAPAPGQVANAAKTCKALKAMDAAGQMAKLGGETFVQAYGTRSNAHGRCVSDQARKLAATSAAAAVGAATAAAKARASASCKEWMDAKDVAQTALGGQSFAQKYGNGNNAYGKCVSDQAKTGVDRVANAARTCKQWSNASIDDQKAALAGMTFAQKYGTAANAYGKCVSSQARSDG
jgi:hypothetical protein